MSKIDITEKKLLKEYNKQISEICDDLEEKSTFSGDEVCLIVTDILKKNKIKNDLSSDELYKIYKKVINDLDITRKEWVDNYGIPEIIGFIYKILEENN